MVENLKKKIVLGIDPGRKGALCWISYPLLNFYDFTNAIDALSYLSVLNHAYGVEFAILEKVWFWKNEKDVKTAEVLIRNSEIWATLLTISKIPFLRVAPAVWRKGLLKKATKKESMAKAKELFPDYADDINRHDRAEAALMAYRAYKHVEAGRPTTLEGDEI